MQIEPFLLERWSAKHKYASPPIRYDLAASTGPGWTVGELLDMAGGDARARLDSITLSYAPANGGHALRTRIADKYGVDPDCVVVTTGASEAFSVLFCLMVESGANVVLPFPVFPAIPALARAWGYEVRSYRLSREQGFEHRAKRILQAVDDDTGLVLVNSPHNPTGAVIAAEELEQLARSLAERGILLVVDEVYHPLYFGTPAATAAGQPNTAVIGDLSKAFSLSGLRIGWVIDPDSTRRQGLVDARGYSTISNAVVTEYLAELALSHSERLLQRLESVAASNLAALDDFMQKNSGRLSWVRPVGGTTAFPWLNSGGDVRPLCEAFAARGVLTAPGDCFGLPEHFRIGFGAEATGFGDALAIVDEVLQGQSTLVNPA